MTGCSPGSTTPWPASSRSATSRRRSRDGWSSSWRSSTAPTMRPTDPDQRRAPDDRRRPDRTHGGVRRIRGRRRRGLPRRSARRRPGGRGGRHPPHARLGRRPPRRSPAGSRPMATWRSVPTCTAARHRVRHPTTPRRWPGPMAVSPTSGWSGTWPELLPTCAHRPGRTAGWRPSASARVAGSRSWPPAAWTSMPPSTATAHSCVTAPPDEFPLRIGPPRRSRSGPASARSSACSAPTTSIRRPEEVTEFERVLAAAGKEFEFHTYEGAGIAFFNTDRPSFRPEAARDGWERIWTFLRRTCRPDHDHQGRKDSDVHLPDDDPGGRRQRQGGGGLVPVTDASVLKLIGLTSLHNAVAFDVSWLQAPGKSALPLRSELCTWSRPPRWLRRP